MAANDSHLDWVLVIAPYRRDAEHLETLLAQNGVAARRAEGLEQLMALLAQTPGVLVATQEALDPEVQETIGRHLVEQPEWSEMPILILLDRMVPPTRVQAELSVAWPRSRQLYYQRPVTMLELLSGVQSSLLARLRQRDVRDHIERESELRRELNHRVKNILSSISSIFQMTRRRAVSLDEFADDFAGRLAALANVHSAVFQANGDAAEFSHIAELTFSPYRAKGADRISFTGPKIMLSAEAATTLALCFHELATNALKYGALLKPEGRISLKWSVSQDGNLDLQWLERGGPPVSEPKRSGYGTRYIRSALYNLFGTPPTILFHPQGLSCTQIGPLARVSPKDLEL
ncbi:sensor histidine kinase [Rhizobium sp. CNPSo 4039]|uniref:sensor histidine kinase n=1 Tax=Rhizobium sp. CNPSo 4039 TaxID=3021409 RepID=UPI00254A4ECB|nr:sensor histidine kinase [Rhizobium sp. CNPSo 4039]MDK4713538.1 sensor histidine kinase [Rhizobium sp. CNPSo 4039]